MQLYQLEILYQWDCKRCCRKLNNGSDDIPFRTWILDEGTRIDHDNEIVSENKIQIDEEFQPQFLYVNVNKIARCIVTFVFSYK